MRKKEREFREVLVINAAKIGFHSVEVGENLWYLWLCELKKWIRDKYKMHPYIVPYGDGKNWHIPNVGKTNVSERIKRLDFYLKFKLEDVKFKNYESALAVALSEIIFKILNP